MEITSHDITPFIQSIEKNRYPDIVSLINLGKKITGYEPKLWGSIIGFGDLKYVYKTGTRGHMPMFGIANRKNAITLYFSYNLESYDELKNLGKFTFGKSCLYVKKLSEINMDVLDILVTKSIHDILNLDFITKID